MPYDAEPDPLPCQHLGADLFFSIRPDEVAWAKTACAGCPVRTDCLHAALDRGEPCGVWGGELFEDGGILPAPRKRGRPRKVAAA